MKAKILTFSSHGDTTLLEYDPATADMEEVNKVIAEYEAKTGAQPFDMASGERLERVTREQNEVMMVHPSQAANRTLAATDTTPAGSVRLRWHWAESDAGGSPFQTRRFLYDACEPIHDCIPRSDRVEVCVRWSAPQVVDWTNCPTATAKQQPFRRGPSLLRPGTYGTNCGQSL